MGALLFANDSVLGDESVRVERKDKQVSVQV